MSKAIMEERAAVLEMHPISHELEATVRVPGSKSLTNRALLVAALAEGPTVLENALFSDDSRYFASALRDLGFAVDLDEAACTMTVTGQGGRIPARQAELFVGNAGTAARFLSAFLTLGCGEYLLDGDARMRERPIGDLVDALRQLGATLPPQAALPLRIQADGLRGGQASVAGDVSSQFLSGLLMAAPYARTPVTIEVTTELNSKPYVELTLAVMADFGVTVERQGTVRFAVPLARYRTPGRYAIESDASAASYFFAAPAILGGRVRVANLSRRSRQGDVAFVDVLREMGCAILEGADFIEVTGPTILRGVDVDLGDLPDTAQTLAVIAPFARTPTRIRGIASARQKETDRVRAVVAELARLGVDVEEHPDGLTVRPCARLRPACVRTYHDHRMAMAFALVGLRVPGVQLEDPACVSKTFPDYFDVLETLR